MTAQRMVCFLSRHLGSPDDSAFRPAAVPRRLDRERASELAKAIDRIERHFIGVMSPDIRTVLAAAKMWDEHERRQAAEG